MQKTVQLLRDRLLAIPEKEREQTAEHLLAILNARLNSDL